jgi:pSer/pThr/pTyr-binding forkhead associated (FHA) protein
MPLSAKLVVVGGDVKTAEIKLRLPTTIGRGRGTTIMLPHPLVSRQHCELYENGGQLMVRDLGSLNGTFVNNQRVTESPLPPGELLTIGTVTFRAVYDAEAAGHPPGSTASPAPGHRRDTSPNGAGRGHRAAAPPVPAPADDDDIEFDFDKPLMPVDEEAAKAGTTPAKKPSSGHFETTIAEAANPGDTQKPAAPATAKPTLAKPDAETIRAPARKDQEDDPPSGSGDDDLGDFLKSLGR